MKGLFNIYLLTSIVISIGVFFISSRLRHQPINQLKETLQKALSGKDLSHDYSAEYIRMVKEAYFPKGYSNSVSFLKPEIIDRIPDDSFFIISLRQLITKGAQESNDLPTAEFEGENMLISSFHVKAKKNFDIIVTLKKVGGRYVFSKISNLYLLLYYHPENRKIFEQFGLLK